MNRQYMVILLLMVSSAVNAELKKSEQVDAKKVSQMRFNPLSGTANVIANNMGDGIFITNNTDGNIVQNNAIGTDLSGRQKMGNSGAGVHININSSNNLIGGDSILANGNLIANNNKGVIVGDSATDLSVHNSIINNSIYNNTLPGIDLANDGPTPNHATSPTTGPNDFQNYPVLNSYTLSSNGLVISWTLNTVASSTYFLQFFSNNVGDPEGKLVLTSINVTTDANGYASGTITVPTVPLNTPITATATLYIDEDPDDTSEFSAPLIYGVAKPCPIVCK